MHKATHHGECQVCGRQQKLPGGVLSKHGYTKRWGFFEGTCPGAGYGPFETHKDQVEASIPRVQGQMTTLRANIARITAEPITDQAPYLEYTAYGKVETTVTVTQDAMKGQDGKQCWVTLTLANGHKFPGSRYGLYGSVEEVVANMRGQRVLRIEALIAEMQRFIEWQQGRIAVWKVQPLRPVEKRV